MSIRSLYAFEVLVLVGSVFVSNQVKALSIESETSVGASSFAQTLRGTGEFGLSEDGDKSKHKADAPVYSWNMGYTFSRVTSTDAATNQKITDQNSEVVGGIGYGGSSGWQTSGGLTYVNSPDENLREVGPQFSIGLTQKFAQEDGFAKRLGARLALSVMDYTQSLPGTATSGRLGRTLSRRGVTNSITQASAEISFTGKPVEWFSARANHIAYGYNRNVNDFLIYLESPQLASSRLASGFASTASGLPRSESGLTITFYFAETWDFALGENYAISAADDSTSWSTKAYLSDEIGDSWVVTLGMRAQQSSNYSDQSALLRISYDF